MKRVLFINHSNCVHGAETVMLQIIAEVFQGMYSSIYVAEPNIDSESKFKKAILDVGNINCIRLPYKSLGVSFIHIILVLIYNIYSILRLVCLVKKEKIQVIYSNTSITCIGVIVAFLTNKKHVWHIHEPVEKEHNWIESFKPIYKLLFLYKKNIFVFVCKKQRAQWINEFPKSLQSARIIYNPIKQVIKEIQVRQDSEVRFGYMGSRDTRKNIPLLLRSFAALNQRYPETRLILAKNVGIDNQLINQIIQDLYLSNKVIESEYLEVSTFYSDIDVFVLPSISETWGLVALEALSAEKALILTQNTGLNEILCDNVDCIFIKPTSQKELFEAMELLVKDKAYRNYLAKNGFEKVNQLDFNKQFRINFTEIFE